MSNGKTSIVLGLVILDLKVLDLLSSNLGHGFALDQKAPLCVGLPYAVKRGAL